MKSSTSIAEEEELETITFDKFAQTPGAKLDREQVMIIKAAICGFLSSAVSGAATEIFRGARALNGLDPWRRLVHSREKGKSVRLEQLRREVKLLYTRKILTLDRVAEGIASFDNKILEYISLGDSAPSNDEMKPDILHILPGDLGSHLLWRASGEVTYTSGTTS